MKPILSIEGLRKHFDGVVALDDFGCTISAGEIVALVGPNGAGKTTLFNVISGFLRPDAGTVQKSGKNVLGRDPHEIAADGIGRTFQKLRLITQVSVLENVLLWFQKQPGERITNLYFRPSYSRNCERQNRAVALELLREVSLSDMAGTLASNLSYGQQKLLSIACCMAAQSVVLLLDEPIAGIAPHMADRVLNVISDLRSGGCAVIMIEHDMDAVEKVADRVVFMNLGRKVCEGTLAEIRMNPTVIEAYL